MLNNTEKLVPKLRLEKFIDGNNWTDFTLGKISESLVYGLNASSKEYDGIHKYLRITDIDDESHLFIKKNLTSPNVNESDLNGYDLSTKDILLARTGASVGKSYIYRKTDGLVYYAGFLIRARIKDDFCAEFIFQNTFTTKYKRFIDVMSQRSGQPGVNAKEYSKFIINIPSLPEQTAIGNFFKKIDERITANEHKLEHLKQQKKGLLQKMFPKKGETVPVMRFKGFEGQWKENKLKNLGEIKSGVGFPDKEQGGISGIPFYKISDMNNVGNDIEMLNSNNYVSKNQISRNNWNPINNFPAIIFAKVGAAIMLNRKRLVNHAFLIDNNTMSFSMNNELDMNFSISMFDNIFLPRYVQIGALPSYNSSEIGAIKVKVPEKEEQSHIGNFFQKYDQLINAQQNKIKHLKRQKQALLQQMFV